MNEHFEPNDDFSGAHFTSSASKENDTAGQRMEGDMVEIELADFKQDSVRYDEEQEEPHFTSGEIQLQQVDIRIAQAQEASDKASGFKVDIVRESIEQNSLSAKPKVNSSRLEKHFSDTFTPSKEHRNYTHNEDSFHDHDNNERRIIEEEQNKQKDAIETRKLREQIIVFALLYLGYVSVHLFREFWAMSKKSLKSQAELMNATDGDTSFTIDEEVLSRFDTIQLFTYAIALYLGGVIGDIVDLRKLLSASYFCLGLSYLILGIGGEKQIESLFYFYFTFFLIGLFSSILWPSMIHILGNWFSKTNRGLIIGAWATCANTGNILGIQVAAILIKHFNGSWQNLIFINAGIMLGLSIIYWFFLIPHPTRVGLVIEEDIEDLPIFPDNQENQPLGMGQPASDAPPAVHQQFALKQHVTTNSDEHQQDSDYHQKVRESQLNRSIIVAELNDENHAKERVSFLKAWLIPRVFLYSATLFTVKLAVNSMLLWMPLLLKEYKSYSVYQIANVSSFFDSGGILGSFFMGYLSDKLYSKRSPISFLAVLVASLLGFILTYQLQFMTQIALSAMMFLYGFIISGLNNIISASCAADIGKQQVVQASQKSQSTVAGIIDGSGSLGAAFGQIIIGVSVTKWGWQQFMLIIAIDITLTAIPLLKIFIEEMKEIFHIIRLNRRQKSGERLSTASMRRNSVSGGPVSSHH